MTADHERTEALLAMIDPFVALADGRHQLLAAIEGARLDGQDLAEILGIVAAHDDALREGALAFEQGARDFSHVDAPSVRAPRNVDARTLDDIDAVRASLVDAIAELADAHADFLDEVIETTWGGSDTWRMHLVALAMHDGAQAHALASRERPGDP